MSPVCCDVSIANSHSKSKLFRKHYRMYLQGLIQLFSFSILNSAKLAATVQFKQQHSPRVYLHFQKTTIESKSLLKNLIND